MNIDYTLWPNTDGNLGNIKVQIPDGVNTFWPEGDALVHNFVYKDGKLAGFVDTKALTVNDSKSTVINYDYFDIELPFTEGEIAITRGERSKYFDVRYTVSNDVTVVITLKYKGCTTVDEVKAVDPDYLTNDIIDGVWKEGLGDLTTGNRMFDGCSKLTTFSSDLSSLTDGSYMFYNCTNLVTFASDLSKLDNGYYMFYNCNLSLDSIECIADSLPTVDTSQNNHYIDIGTLVTASTYAPIEKPSQQINWKETMYGPAIIKMENKGWVVATNNIRI